MSRAYHRLPTLDIASGDFSLRCIEGQDIETVRAWRNAQMDVLRQRAPITGEEQRAYFARSIWPQMELARPDTILLMMLRKGKRIGYGGLVHCAWEHARAEISVLFDPAIAADREEYRPCLLAFLEMLEEVAFRRLGFHRLTLETYDIRPFHVSLIEQAGYSCEGRLRDHVMMDGRPVDSLLHAKITRRADG